MGCSNSGPILPPPRILPGPSDWVRIIIEVIIGLIIEDALRKIGQQQNLYLLSQTSNAIESSALRSFNNDNEATRLNALIKSEATMSTEEKVSKLLNEIPPGYEDQLQNPEELIKRLNVDVPPEFMPEVAAALKNYYHQRHPAG